MQKEIMDILKKNPNGFFDSEELCKLIGIGKKNISRSMSILIKYDMVKKKLVLKHKSNLPSRNVRCIKFKK